MSWKPTEHPWFTLPTKEEAQAIIAEHGEQALLSALEERERRIELARKDPFAHGVRLPHWTDADAMLEEYDRLLVSGGNRSGKTQYGARLVAEMMAKNPGTECAVFSMTAASSVRDLQPAVYEWLPTEWKSAKKGKVTNIVFSRKNGFSDNVFIGVNGSRCNFLHYSQSSDVLEGAECDLIWFDELVPWSWVETAAYRLITRRGKMLITATPITGWTPVVNDFMSNMRVLESKTASLLDQKKVHVKGCAPGHMPYRAECMREDSGVIFFRTEDNPFQPKKEIERVLKSETESQKRCRAYGYVEQTQAGFFPRFSNAHKIDPKRVPSSGVTRYMVCDPAGSRMWSALWIAVDSNGVHYVYREFPSVDEFGYWAEVGEKAEGVIGEAAKPQGWGLNDYRREFLRLEAGEEIAERLIDPRAGGTSAATEDGSETLIDLLGTGENALHFIPASGINIEQGIDRINDLLSFDPEEPISVVNQPKLLVSSECENLIRSMQNLTAAGGDKNKWKDPVDCLRYAAVHGCTHYESGHFGRSEVGGTY